LVRPREGEQVFMSTSVEAVALDYLKRGWSVIPIRSRDKRPAVPWLAY
jgi:hypothetical protein